MQDHSVIVDHTPTPAAIAFAPVFNVAVPFIDRHLSEGRSGKTAIRTVGGDVTYGALADQVNRCGNVLRETGLSPGDRLLMIVKDCPAFFFLCWGAIKVGVVPVPVNTLLRAPDYQYMIEDSVCAAVVYSPEYAAEAGPALASAARRPKVFVTEGTMTRCKPVWLGPPQRLRRRPLPRTTIASGSIPPVRRGGRQRPYTGTATSWSPACTMRWTPWASAPTTSVFPPPNCSLPTVWATP